MEHPLNPPPRILQNRIFCFPQVTNFVSSPGTKVIRSICCTTGCFMITDGFPDCNTSMVSHITMICFACASLPTAASMFPVSEMAMLVTSVWCTLSIATHLPVSTSHNRINGIFPVCTLANSVPSLLTAIAAISSVCPVSMRCSLDFTFNITITDAHVYIMYLSSAVYMSCPGYFPLNPINCLLFSIGSGCSKFSVVFFSPLIELASDCVSYSSSC
mmetsp:Transcript_6005/g.8746  ORF Transcript_6005/g.8746 Transcript_6005/m.8746 type:complete len:216 (-) Transcript_6005:94-741(-)